MAAVVKVKKQNTVSDAEVKKTFGNKVTKGKYQLTVPLLSEHDEESDNCVVDVDNASNTAMRKQALNSQSEAAATNVVENIEDGEVIGIITLEDVFEELLQVTFVSPSLKMSK